MGGADGCFGTLKRRVEGGLDAADDLKHILSANKSFPTHFMHRVFNLRNTKVLI